MANTYQGSAVITVDGAEYPAEVDMSITVDRNNHGADVLKSWGGSLDSAPEIDWFGAPTSHEAMTRMPDGREGRFFATEGALGSGRVEICGTGPAPFSDA